MTRTFSTVVLLAVTGLSLATVAPAYAQLIAADSFRFGDPANAAAGEYNASPTNDGRLNPPGGPPGQNPTIFGFTGQWTGDDTSLWHAVETPLEHPSIAGEAGGSARFQFATEVGHRGVRRSLATPPTITTGETFWMSALVQIDELDPDLDGFAWAGFASGNDNGAGGNDVQGLKIGVNGDGSEMDLVYRHRTGGSTMTTSTLLDGLTAGETHLVVLRAMVNSDLGGGGVNGNDNVSIWVDPADVSSESALGTSIDFEDFSLFSNDAFDFLALDGSNITGAGVRFDELFLGRTLADVATAAPAAVPEPSTFALAAVGLLGLALFGRRGRR